jgi:predicted dehydrogenase
MKIGLIGCGRIARAHMMIYQYIKNARVLAVSDVDLDKARIFANNYGIEKVFTNYVDLLEIKDLDFIDVCTPTSTHASIVCDAAKSGHNILLEKPMALSTSECERMIHEVERSKISLCICHNQIFFPAILRAKYLIDLGYYDVISFRTYVKLNPHIHGAPAWNITSEEKGIIWEEGCHPAYLHLHILGDIEEVYAVGNKVKYPVFDEFSVLLRTSNGPYGIMEVSWLARESEKTYEIESRDGKRAFMSSPPPYANYGYDVLTEITGATKRGLYHDIKRILRRFVSKNSLGYYIGHFYLINSYIKSLINGSPPPVKPQDGKNTIRLLECIEQSINTHKIVRIRENQ